MSSTRAPRVSKIRLTFAFWRPKPIWMPRKPKLMFQISQNESFGFGRAATGAAAAVDAIDQLSLQFEHVTQSGAKGTSLWLCLLRCAQDDIGHFSGRIRTACPPPGARTTRSRLVEVTGRLEMVTGSGLSSQSALGPSA